MKKMTVDYKENVEKDKNALKYSVKLKISQIIVPPSKALQMNTPNIAQILHL
jgi:hypothetical protein